MSRTRGTARWVRRLLVTLSAAAVMLVCGPISAHAHSGLVTSSPSNGAVLSTAPDSATLTFNEPVNPLPASFQLYDTSGAKRPLTISAVDTVVTVQLPPDIARGTHVLSWRVVSADSHPISGAIPFSVGEASSGAAALTSGEGQPGGGTSDIAYLVAQVAAYLGLMAAVGLALFEVVVLRSSAEPSRARERVIAAAVATTILGHVALVPLTLIRAQGTGLGRLLDSSTFISGLSSAAGLALALVVLGGSALLLTPVLARPVTKVVVTALGTSLAVLAVLPVGHTRTVAPVWLMMSTDVVHVVTGAMWFGGVIGLAMHLRTARRSGVVATTAAGTVARFSGLAGGLVAALAATGAVMSVLVVGSVDALLDTNYGRTLLVKIAFAVVIALLAVWNKVYLVPSVRRPPAADAQWRRLHGAVRDEAALLVAVLCVTGLLSMQSPNLAADAPPVAPAVAQFRSPLGTGAVDGVVKPARTGDNELEFDVRGADGKPLAPVSLPAVSATLPEADLGPLVGKVRRGDRAGSYRATIALPLQGRWKLKVSVRVDEFTSPTVEQDITVAP